MAKKTAYDTLPVLLSKLRTATKSQVCALNEKNAVIDSFEQLVDLQQSYWLSNSMRVTWQLRLGKISSNINFKLVI